MSEINLVFQEFKLVQKRDSKYKSQEKAHFDYYYIKIEKSFPSEVHQEKCAKLDMLQDKRKEGVIGKDLRLMVL